NLGIRRRLAPLVDNDRRRIELLNCLLLTLPGSPIIYYGDEIGMGYDGYLGDRNGVRTPMQWSRDRNGGVSTPAEATLYLPVFAGVRPIEILGDTVFPPIQAAPYVVSVGPHGFYWFRLDRSDGAEEPYGIESTAI